MLSDSVAQNPIIPVSAGKNAFQNCPALGCPGSNAEGCESIGPKPPALRYAHSNNSRPRAIKSGALIFNSQRMHSIPLYTTTILIAQNRRKHISCAELMPKNEIVAPDATDGTKIAKTFKIPLPPIHAA